MWPLPKDPSRPPLIAVMLEWRDGGGEKEGGDKGQTIARNESDRKGQERRTERQREKR